MSILTLPETPAFSSASFGLTSNIQTFENPLTGQSQVLERPGARWQASYTLPPMTRAQAAQWQAFLLRLRGGAVRFYGFDPDARRPRGTGAASAIGSRNEIRNSICSGAVVGTIGAGGSAPTYWSFGPAYSLSRFITATGEEAGMPYIEVRIVGTPSGNASLAFDGGTQIAASEGETWTGSFYYRLVSGSLNNISAVQQYISQLKSDGTILQNTYAAVGTVDSSWRRAVYTKALSDTTPDTTRIRSGLYLSLIAGQPMDITLRLAQPQLERINNPSASLPTSGAARSRDAGPRTAGQQVAGTTLSSWNWMPAQTVLKTGDYVAFDGSGGRELHMLTADAVSDANGRASLQVEPPLRNPPPDNTALLIEQAACAMALDDQSVRWSSDAQGVMRLSFGASERF